MRCTVNGKPYNFQDDTLTINEMFNTMNLKPEGRIVEWNGEIISENKYSSVEIKNGDSLEIIQFMGGG